MKTKITISTRNNRVGLFSYLETFIYLVFFWKCSMTQKGLTGFFEKYLTKEPLFKNKKVLQANYTPEVISYRDNQIKQIAKILAPCLREEKPSNLFLYGKTGTGKTLSITYTMKHIEEVATQREIPIKIIYLNCKLKKVADTEYRLIAQLAREFGKAIPPTGLPTEEVYNIFCSVMDKEQTILLLILDEIDELAKRPTDEILYNLTRINSDLKNSQLSVIGISNSLIFADNLDPRVKSSLSEEEVIFPPYNALQIQQILRQRAKHAFHGETLEEGILEKCAAFAAREHGDARRAIELLRVAAELAERGGYEKVKIDHLDEAEDKIEKDKIMDIITTQPRQFQLILYAILIIYEKRNNKVFTGEVYELYKGLCIQTAMRPLTQRRVSDVIGEFDMLGLINAKVISKGRYGRTREISVSPALSSLKKMKKILAEELDLS